MTEFENEKVREPVVDATAATQDAGHAEAGGTYSQDDLSRASRRSKDRTTANGLPTDSNLQRPVRDEEVGPNSK